MVPGGAAGSASSKASRREIAPSPTPSVWIVPSGSSQAITIASECPTSSRSLRWRDLIAIRSSGEAREVPPEGLTELAAPARRPVCSQPHDEVAGYRT